jgi:uncharacterized protein (TIGR03118 family)
LFPAERRIVLLPRTNKLFAAFVGVAALAGICQAQYRQVNLVSDGFLPAVQNDPNLINGWGMDFSPTSPIWVANQGTGTSTLYQNDGTIVPLVVKVPPARSSPTGLVFYGGENFRVSKGENTAPARFIFVTLNGVISGWSPTVDQTNAIAKRRMEGAVYTGATIGMSEGQELLFAANFRSGFIDVFDNRYRYVTSFTDLSLPRSFAPYNVKAYGNYLFVTYAMPGPAGVQRGPGLGYVDVFLTNGHFVQRLVSNGVLNAPFGLALKINKGNRLLTQLHVGNFGDGMIHRWDFLTGEYQGVVRDENKRPLQLPGLWSIAFRNVAVPDSDTVNTQIFFTAGPENETHGLFGTLIPTPRTSGTP